MDLYIKINTEETGYSNLKEMLESPYEFNVEVFDYINITYSEIGKCTKENIETLSSIVAFEITEENYDTVIEFVKECEYEAIKQILIDNLAITYIQRNSELLVDRFGINQDDIYFTDKEIYIDRYLKNAYKLKNNKMIFIGKAKDILLKCELEWFDTIYIKNLKFRKLIKLLNIKNLKYFSKKEMIKELENKMETELIDAGEISEDVIRTIDDNIYNEYIYFFCTKEAYEDFLRRNYG